jgi:response regulator RpfG family c-di-GMP phosphodiesterase
MRTVNYKDVDKTNYDQYSFDKDLLYIRPVLVLCIFLYGTFGLMDYLYYPEYLDLFLKIRFFFVIPFFLTVLAFSYHKIFFKTYQYMLSGIFIIGGLGIIVMIISIEGDNFYYGGLYLVFSVAFFLLRIKPIYATIGTTILILTYVALSLLYQVFPMREVLAQTVFYSGFAIIGIVGSNYHEQYRLNQYYHESITLGEKIVLEKKNYEQYEEIKNYHSATIFAIARLAEARDDFTGGHINRVGQLSKLLAQNIPDIIYKQNGINKHELVNSIELASILHDIGKISISDVILNKPGKLTKDEFEIIQTHTIIGYETLLSLQEDYHNNYFVSLGLQISKSHHERWDGTGYPEGLKGSKIPLAARIVAIIDVYDALVSQRPYKGPYSKEKSIALIEDGVGTHFDPHLASIFIKLARESKNNELFDPQKVE